MFHKEDFFFSLKMNLCLLCLCVLVSASMWRSEENSQKSGLSFHYGGYMAQTQVIRPDKCLYVLSQLTNPNCFIFKIVFFNIIK